MLPSTVGRNRKPLGTASRLDFVSISPVSLGVLYIVIENEQIDVMDNIEVSLPGDIVGLEYGYSQRRSRSIKLLCQDFVPRPDARITHSNW